jgi:hypothetical protein
MLCKRLGHEGFEKNMKDKVHFDENVSHNQG